MVHPALLLHQIPEVPSLRFDPAVIHLIKTMTMFEMPEAEEVGLSLDIHELREFGRGRKGFAQHVLDTFRRNLPDTINNFKIQFRSKPDCN